MRSAKSAFAVAAAFASITGALVASPAVFAQESGAYLGAALGQAKFKEWCDTGGSTTITLTACKDTDTSWKVFGGYRFNRYLAVEASYIDWGEVTATTSTAVSVSANQRSYGIAGVGSVPISPRFALFGKVGFLQTDQQTKRISPNPSTEERDETEVHYGLGAKYALTRNLGMRAEWENTDKLKVRMFSVGIEYSFTPVLIADAVSYAGLYVGGSVGQMKAEGNCPPGFTCDLKDTGWKVFGGYQLHRNFAVEVTYGAWGDITLSTQAGSTTVTGTGGISSWGVAALGFLPLGSRFSAFGKAGVLITEQEIAASGGGITSTAVNDGAEFHWGFGAIFNISRNWGLRAEWERLNKSEVDFMSLGIQYKF